MNAVMHLRLLSGLLATVIGIVPPDAAATPLSEGSSPAPGSVTLPDPAPRPTFQHRLTAGAEYIKYLGTAFPGIDYYGLAVAHQLEWSPGIQVYYGIRFALRPDLSRLVHADGFVGAALAPHFGRWAPSVGVEVGVSGAVEIQYPGYIAPERPRVHLQPAYVEFVAAPIRFELGRAVLAVGVIGLGASFPNLAEALRIQVTAFRFEWRM